MLALGCPGSVGLERSALDFILRANVAAGYWLARLSCTCSVLVLLCPALTLSRESPHLDRLQGDPVSNTPEWRRGSAHTHSSSASCLKRGPGTPKGAGREGSVPHTARNPDGPPPAGLSIRPRGTVQERQGLSALAGPGARSCGQPWSPLAQERVLVMS